MIVFQNVKCVNNKLSIFACLSIFNQRLNQTYINLKNIIALVPSYIAFVRLKQIIIIIPFCELRIKFSNFAK